MRKNITWIIIIALVCSPILSVAASVHFTPTTETQKQIIEPTEKKSTPPMTQSNPHLAITSPEAGYLYLFQLQPIQMTFANMLGLRSAVVIGRNLYIDTISTDIHHAKFVAKGKYSGWEMTRWDYRTLDGLGLNLGLNSGFYTITVHGYDESDNELCSDSINVLYLKVGREDFGVWVNTKYNSGETITTPLKLGMTDFASMLNTGQSRAFQVPLQQKDDTTVELRFIRTKIMNNTEKVIETKFNILTTADTTNDYEVSVEVRFPFIMLEGGTPSEKNNPYFSATVGYESTAAQGGINQVNTTFYVGRETIDDPRVFRFSVKPSNIESGSNLQFFSRYLTVDSTGSELLHRIYTIDFWPATELTITSIPTQAKISYEFGRSAGVPTTISVRAEGGLLDDIVQSFQIDPLPGYMNFDLTVIGEKEFLYESDRSYNVTYSLDSLQNGNIVKFQVDSLPERIAATWGLNLGNLGDLAASSFAQLDMSQDVKRIALYLKGAQQPFISLHNLPRKIRFENAVDLLDGTGNITLIRGLDEIRQINVTIAHEDILVVKSFELKNNFVQMQWKIDAVNGKGFFDVTRDSERTMVLSTSIFYNSWTFTKTLELKNTHLQLSWDVNRNQRTGEIILSRDAVGGSPTLTFSLAHDGWVLSDTLQMKNTYMKLFWQLPTAGNTHVQLGLITTGGELFHNTISVIDNTVELFRLDFGIKTDDHLILSWDYVNGQISNFQWSGRILQLSQLNISANLIGEVFSIKADLNVGEEGQIELQFNKPVSVNFINTESNMFKIQGEVSFHANRRLQISWELGESGEFRIYTYGQPIGDQFNLIFGYDPQQTGNYKFGFSLSGSSFVSITRTIKWYSQNGQLVRIWILGDVPMPGDWTLQVLWNSQWYPVPWN